ncbi:MAG: hypothetical protein CLLPBCKN_006748 [Chroococcidiopsis cubana SAG 39.79]|uniref:ATPase n=1 Tax=Chroococcidiopsis cubana SAG 39.79 TaxID=388085 RepID=A0AB37UCL9_9CYAN|nr:MoxR family ATPase [Chroococcidiopsis cubana]MDZ4877313.1 hypothetical protein [Chroococcidiopsis cubana SAG 39.79]PSB62433.1 ATPase [Chroococcidiopsis cubana CCALA 043]RUT05875.1 ATPase [Chroococcidiopsis cubana SAG 39.79]
MKTTELEAYLNCCIAKRLQNSIMIWGASGLGKSSIVKQVAKENNLKFRDLRLSQILPSDLRGLPVADGGCSKWLPPNFLPHDCDEGILFLDEINMAPPAVQGVAQQLILDRCVGSYTVPEGWFIWAAGNRKEDRASVFDMPAPVANRFLHLQLEPDLDSFRAYALANNFNTEILAFLSFRPELLHKQSLQPAWPSPRSWEMANTLYSAGLGITTAVGPSTAAEFKAFLDECKTIPDLSLILEGKRDIILRTTEPSVKYAIAIGLAARAADAEQAYNAFTWLNSTSATAEWMQLYAVNVFPLMKSKGQIGTLANLIHQDPSLREFLQNYQKLAGL